MAMLICAALPLAFAQSSDQLPTVISEPGAAIDSLEERHSIRMLTVGAFLGRSSALMQPTRDALALYVTDYLQMHATWFDANQALEAAAEAQCVVPDGRSGELGQVQ